MDLQKLLVNYVNNRERHPRKIGRFNSSDIYNILSGELTPENYFKDKKKDLFACKNITEGEIREMALKLLFDASKVKFEYQVKGIWKEPDFEIVCVTDFLFKDKVVECKSPMKFSGGIKDYHKPQLEAQFRIFNRPVYALYLKERWDNQIFRYKPDPQLWDLIIKKLGEFQTQLKVAST